MPVEGTHDFDHDGDADILWQQSTGEVVVWHLQAGELSSIASFGASAPSWRIAGTGEFDGL